MGDFIYQVQMVGIPSDESVCKNEDGSFTIFLNKNNTFEKQQEAFLHAMYHIENEHFDNRGEKDPCKLEVEAHENRRDCHE